MSNNKMVLRKCNIRSPIKNKCALYDGVKKKDEDYTIKEDIKSKKTNEKPIRPRKKVYGHLLPSISHLRNKLEQKTWGVS